MQDLRGDNAHAERLDEICGICSRRNKVVDYNRHRVGVGLVVGVARHRPVEQLTDWGLREGT
jgi:hypothetical protein